MLCSLINRELLVHTTWEKLTITMWLMCEYCTHFSLFSVFFTSWTTTENMIRHAMIVDSLVKQHPSVNNTNDHKVVFFYKSVRMLFRLHYNVQQEEINQQNK